MKYWNCLRIYNILELMMVIFMENKEIVDEFADSLYRIGEQHSKDLKQLLDIILSDFYSSYDKLIEQRKECIDLYIKIISFLLQDERDIGKPIKSLMEKQHDDVAKFEKEIIPIKEFQDLLFGADDPSDDELQKVIDEIQNI